VKGGVYESGNGCGFELAYDRTDHFNCPDIGHLAASGAGA